MLTWLDYYVAGALDRFQGTPLTKSLRTDREAIQWMCLSNLAS
ncbi:hypothetical protein Nhal_4029 (plasmid) [Nitrosococcus halophilus Nc 4]|uniref:Uncharacterized protein n=1 Tax=Nitrosococcus halophilus (strain Nc4) TaxID=472759 RepID=D5C5I2_NITHN|nr:hypothetical protein [Nitrosococcus halophilus]ADE17036.1 hypothetical protein Nhal_4029 [Nitrosococcus halophilus Nc 4]